MNETIPLSPLYSPGNEEETASAVALVSGDSTPTFPGQATLPDCGPQTDASGCSADKKPKTVTCPLRYLFHQEEEKPSAPTSGFRVTAACGGEINAGEGRKEKSENAELASTSQSSPTGCDVATGHALKAAGRDDAERSVAGTHVSSSWTCHTAPAHQRLSPCEGPPKPGSEDGLSQKQRAPRRRCQQPKMLSSPEDTMYYNQLNGTLEYQGSQRKPRKLGQIKVLDGEDQYYKSLSPGACVPEESDSAHCFCFPSSPRGDSVAQH
ncbi:myosin-IIIb-like [Peromyscus leucopus]|uniref:myosin-IIIb-like n=1 Tax=Peromyscus leucopus TaxID=10041 RepID=UPI001885966C|nr:myosin-IIIb-like [Peromyscus leucopus]